MKVSMKVSISIVVLLLMSLNSYAAQTCKDYIPNETPTSRYTIDAVNGTVLDSQTGLMWQQCSVGQTAAGGGCTGTASTLNWQGALQAGEASTVGGYTNWRLPNLKELRSIVAYNCYSPSINIAVFPSTVSNRYWTSSPYASYSSDAWYVSFYYGSDVNDSRSYDYYVRLVR